MLKNKKLYFLSAAATAVAITFMPVDAISQSLVNNINITGNKRIEDNTVRSYLSFSEGQTYTNRLGTEAIKRLYKTGLFEDVTISNERGSIDIQLKENAVINKVSFEGNDELDEEDLQKEIIVKPLTSFSKELVMKDILRLKNIYTKSGLFGVEITPETTGVANNKVNLTYKIKEGKKSYINDISFKGNSFFSDSTLRGVISTSEEAWYKFLGGNDVFDEDRLEFDKELLRRKYFSEGYADFEVRDVEHSLNNEGDYNIVFTVDEGARYKIKDVVIDSALPQINIGEMKEEIKTQPQDVYDADEVESSIQTLTEEAGQLGYAFVDTEANLKKDRDAAQLDIFYNIKEGPKTYVNRINIEGNERTEDYVLRREFRVAEGDPFNTQEIKRSRQRLQNLGYFKDVKFDTVKTPVPGRVDINVEVEEQPTGELSFGAGFSTVDGFVGDVSLQENNVLGRGQKLKLKFSGGTRSQVGELSFTEPYLFGNDISAGFDIFSIRRNNNDISSFTGASHGITGRAGYSVSEHLRHSLYATARRDEIDDIQSGASTFIQQQEGEYDTLLLGHQLTYDKRDNRFDPTEGYVLRLKQEYAGLGQDTRYFKNDASARVFFPLDEDHKFVFRLAADAGNIKAIDGDEFVRINNLFFVGGRNLRGFDRGGIGPRDLSSDDALGGDTYYTGSAELQFPLGLPENLGIRGLAFVDAGNLTNTDRESTAGSSDADELRVSAGGGIFWRSPFGPISISYAEPIKKQPEDDIKRFQFNFGTRF